MEKELLLKIQLLEQENRNLKNILNSKNFELPEKPGDIFFV